MARGRKSRDCSRGAWFFLLNIHSCVELIQFAFTHEDTCFNDYFSVFLDNVSCFEAADKVRDKEAG